ncbi:sugar-binding protein [Amaricoccus sp.]|uniref:substrate-binding domain-containing protein n=1 Tax=Amaricoccus sp. TaxID=1872485 RepID=UPI0026355441|nr:sugar-binding protein [Amaricoccus sp.]HRO12816.1 sugar ABC transporter substrate-binding protein [Amaricoccus sp.]
MRLLRGFLVGATLWATCAAPAHAQTGGALVGIALPAEQPARWVRDGKAMVAALESAGLTADLAYAGDDVPHQIAQIEAMIDRGARALVVAATDGTALAGALASAHAAGIPVIAYDRLIRDTADVDYYVTFDSFQVGVLQGQALLACLGPLSPAAPRAIEIFGGALADGNADDFHDGAMSVLEPAIGQGGLVIGSGQTGMDEVGTLGWDPAVAGARMQSLLSGHYSRTRLDGVLSPDDALSLAILSALEAVGYGSAEMPMPCVTGQDADIASVRSIIAGGQNSTVFKDTRALAQAAVGMVLALLDGGTPAVTDGRTYNNGAKAVPAQVLAPVLVDRSNWEKKLVGSGYYTRDEIGG